MGITKDTWLGRIRHRSDIVSFVTHLTREAAGHDPLANLYAILKARKLVGSSSTGFIIGSTPAVCLQDAPLSGICANIHAEEAFRAANPNAPLRYSAIGLAFRKPRVFRAGGRPVFYEDSVVARGLLPAAQHWRIVSFDLTKEDDFVDWTHEREWRVPGDFAFDPVHTMVLLPNTELMAEFISNVKARSGIDPAAFGGHVNLDIVTA